MSKIKAFLAKVLHRHEWEYFDLEVNPELHAFHEPYYHYRYCHECKTHEQQITHCLGLNPPRYTSHWQKCAKPHYKWVGDKCVKS